MQMNFWSENNCVELEIFDIKVFAASEKKHND